MRASKYSPEVRERSVQLVLEQVAQHTTQWHAITSIAEKIGCTAEMIRSLVRQYERDSEKERVKALERDNRRLLISIGYIPPAEAEANYYATNGSTARV